MIVRGALAQQTSETHARWFTNRVAATAALGGFLFGYDTGVISGALLFLRVSFSLDARMQSIVTGSVLAGATAATIFGGWLADRFGRRTIMMVLALFFVVGALVSAVAPSVSILIAGRALIGICIGIVSFVAPLYVAELAPAGSRGALVSLNQLALTVGILASYGVNSLFALGGHWRWMLGLGAIPGGLLLAGMITLPESPRWLMKVGREDAARTVLSRLRASATDANQEIEEIRLDLSVSRDQSGWDALLAPTLRRPLFVGAGLAILQQITGINTVIYYAPTILQSAGFQSAPAAILATTGVGIVIVIASFTALQVIDRLGRRALLLMGTCGMAVALSAFAGICQFGRELPGFRWMAVVSVMAYVAFFAIGLGPVFWLMISEIFPIRIRGRAMAIATLVNWGFNLIVALTFLGLLEAAGAAPTFLLYAIVSAASFFFALYFVPETKGRTLEQIERIWADQSVKSPSLDY